MKKLKALCVVLVAALAIVPMAHAFASEPDPTGKYQVTAKPTPIPKSSSVKSIESNTQDSLCSELSDYNGRIKEESHIKNGDEWTVVFKVGAGFADEELPEGFSDWETVYQETFPLEECVKDFL